MICKNCGNTVNEGDVFCGSCGAKINNEAGAENEKAQPLNAENGQQAEIPALLIRMRSRVKKSMQLRLLPKTKAPMGNRKSKLAVRKMKYPQRFKTTVLVRKMCYPRRPEQARRRAQMLKPFVSIKSTDHCKQCSCCGYCGGFFGL